MRRLFGCPDIVSLTEKFLMARNFYRVFTENNPVMGDSKTFGIPEAKGLTKSPWPRYPCYRANQLSHAQCILLVLHTDIAVYIGTKFAAVLSFCRWLIKENRVFWLKPRLWESVLILNLESGKTGYPPEPPKSSGGYAIWVYLWMIYSTILLSLLLCVIYWNLVCFEEYHLMQWSTFSVDVI